MENSSKALLIAAAILIVILLVTISIKILTSPKDVSEQAESVGEMISSTVKDVSQQIGSSFDIQRESGTSGSTGEIIDGSTGGIIDETNREEQDIPESYVSANWTDNGNGTFSKGTTTVKIGDYVNYNEGSYTHTPDTAKGAGTEAIIGESSLVRQTLKTKELTTEDLKWRVLSVNGGKIELISADPTTQKLCLTNDEGYVNAEDNLNNFCNDLYGHGEGASGARSLNVDDINKLTNYDPKTYSRYGAKWTYRYPTTTEVSGTRYMQYSKDGGTTWTNITDSRVQTFRLPEETTAISSTNPDSKELEYTYYSYSINSNLETNIVNMLKKGTKNQWLASRCVICNSQYAEFNVRLLNNLRRR